MRNKILSFAAVAVWAAAVENGAVEIIAHRGASHDAPENTLSAVKLAWEQNADAVEFDIWYSKDGRVVVMHDADTKRVGGPARRISDQTWEELQKVDVGAWKGAKFAGERIPTIDSILATVPAGKRAVIEIKCGPEILPALGQAIERSARKPEELVIISFNFEALKQSKKKFPNIEHFFLSGYKKDERTGLYPELAPMIKRAREANFDGLNLNYNWPIDRAFVSEVKAADLKMLVWTVNDAEVARRLADAGVDAITTDRPAWLREQLKRSSSAGK